MIWGIGAPRSGTMTLAYLRGGVHEPRPVVDQEVFEYTRNKIEGQLAIKLAARAKLETPIVVDCTQTFAIPMIKAVDPAAEWVVLIRNPVDCVRSLLARGTYLLGTRGNDYRPRPEKWPEDYDFIDKCAWYWKWTYKVVLRDLSQDFDHRVEIIRTEDLPFGVRLNVDNRTAEFKLSKDDEKRIREACMKTYREVLDER